MSYERHDESERSASMSPQSKWILRVSCFSVAVSLWSCQLDISLFSKEESSSASGEGGFGGLGGGGAHVDRGGQQADSAAEGGRAVLRYGTPRELTTVTTGADAHPSFPEDRLELYFGTLREGWPRVWVSKRDRVEDPWGTPSEVSEISKGELSDTSLTMPAVSSDGLTLLYARFRPGASAEIVKATRPDRDSPFGDIVRQGIMHEETVFGMPSAPLDMSSLFFVQDTGQGDIWVAQAASSEWSTPQAVEALNSTVMDEAPWISDDALTIGFTSSRAGSSDIYVARRRAASDAFTAPAAIDSLNTEFSDRDAWFSQDMRYVVLSSTRNESTRLFEAEAID